MSPTRKELTIWLSKIDVSGSTLDIGGNVWSMREQVKSFDGDYRTINEYEIDLNKIQNFGLFDNIFCTEVIHFVYDPYSVLCNLHNALKTGGKLFLSFHLTHPPMKGHDYLRYTERGIRKLLEVTGFKLEELIEPSKGYFLVICSRL